MLAMLEAEVAKQGGSFAFCDTDSLAINCGDPMLNGVPVVSSEAIDAFVELFDRLNPYDQAIVPHLLKIEYPQYPDLRCFAVFAKRYILLHRICLVRTPQHLVATGIATEEATSGV